MKNPQPAQTKMTEELARIESRPVRSRRLAAAISFLFAAAILIAIPARAADYNLGALAKDEKIELFNRALDPAKAGSPEAVCLTAAANDGLAWVSGIEFSEGTIELEIKGKDQRGQSFVGIAFHGQDNNTFDAVYLRPFNFQAPAPQQSHSIQYVAMPQHDWSNLRTNHPGKYEAAIKPAPGPDSWVKLKLVVKGNNAAAFVNDASTPALTVELLNDRPAGKVGLWVGNGSDGWFKNLKVTSAKN
jgi:hypothetical protein